MLGDEEKNDKAEEYLNGWKRAQADLINYKKDEAGRLEGGLKFGNESILMEIISVTDSFDFALASMEKTGPVEKGICLIKTQIDDLLKRHGIEKIFAKAGDVFNPAMHEAIATAEVSEQSGTIVEEIESGYTLHGKVVRPARVRVSK